MELRIKWIIIDENKEIADEADSVSIKNSNMQTVAADNKSSTDIDETESIAESYMKV